MSRRQQTENESDGGAAVPSPTMSDPQALSPLAVYARLLRYVKPNRGTFALGMCGGLAYAAAMAGFAPYAKKFPDGTLHVDPRTIIWLPLALIGLLFLRSIGDFTQTYFTGYVSRRVVTNIRQQVFDAIQRLPDRGRYLRAKIIDVQLVVGGLDLRQKLRIDRAGGGLARQLMVIA